MSARRTLTWLLALLANPVWADPGNVTPHGFISIFRDEVKASPADLWQAVVQLPRWWSSQHTYSGQALQELPVTGVLTFTIAMQETKTILRVTYRVSGPPDVGLDKLAPVVDQVIGHQFKRLKSLAETGKPE